MEFVRVAVESALGPWVIEGDSQGISQVYSPRAHVAVTTSPVPAAITSAARQLEQYFAGTRRSFDCDLHLSGTPFRQEVWLAVAQIPFGQLRTYGEIAADTGRPSAYRAVGTAVGHNPWAIFVPCHRVVASNSIGGYGGGLDLKRYLLHLEGVTDYD